MNLSNPLSKPSDLVTTSGDLTFQKIIIRGMKKTFFRVNFVGVVESFQNPEPMIQRRGSILFQLSISTFKTFFWPQNLGFENKNRSKLLETFSKPNLTAHYQIWIGKLPAVTARDMKLA